MTRLGPSGPRGPVATKMVEGGGLFNTARNRYAAMAVAYK